MLSSIVHLSEAVINNFISAFNIAIMKHRACLFCLFLFIASYTSSAQTLPAGFSQVLVANGIQSPTAMAFAPDGRIFVCQQNGQLRVVKNNALLSQPMISLTVTSSGERGLIGIALDPNFAVNHYIYLYYTLPTGSNNRISRFTASGDAIIAGSEIKLLDLDPLSTALNHNGGTMQFGADGKLYVGIGENANPPNAQNLDTYHGKILRINADGSIPSGNPFTTGSAQRQRVWAYGVRNPYTISVQPGTGRLFVNDVGEISWEEINDATVKGFNFGWPTVEGTASNPLYKDPIYNYGHGTTAGTGCAITGGTFFNPASTNYPAQYIGKYFYIDYCSNWIDMLTLSGSTATRANFGTTSGGGRVYIGTGTDGNLYFLSRVTQSLFKITYTTSALPVITSQPASISVPAGNAASFSVGVSGTGPFTYQWRKNGSSITGATASIYKITSVISSDSGKYSVVVRNAAGAVTSTQATLTVLPPNKKPDATIKTPAAGALYSGGSTINFSGLATDPEDGSIPASRLKWYVLFYHDTHNHPGPTIPTGVSSGSFTIPTTGEKSSNVFYRLFLVATDSRGATDTAFTDILPRKSVITLQSIPTGMNVTLDGQPVKTPYKFTGVEGIVRSFGAVSPQLFNGVTYVFSKWSNTTTQTQSVSTPVRDSTFTATFTKAQSISIKPLADAHVNSAANAAKNYGAATIMYNRNNDVSIGNSFTYLKFDISSLANFTSIKLRIFARWDNGTSLSSIQAYNVPVTTWLENTITYNTKPAIETTKIASATISGTTGKYYELDITAHIKTLRSQGIKTVSYRLKNATLTTNYILINSKENASNKPELKVTFANTALATTAPSIFEPLDNDYDAEISAYPNPAQNMLQLHYPESLRNGVLQIMDVYGRIVLTQQVNGITTQAIDVKALKAGTYFITLKTDKEFGRTRIIIQK
jgi:glucose/arabinose dehydrogenase